MGFPSSSAGKESACNAGDPGSSPGEGKGYPLQYSGLEKSMDCIHHGVAKSQTQLNDFPFPFTILCVIISMIHCLFISGCFLFCLTLCKI